MSHLLIHVCLMAFLLSYLLGALDTISLAAKLGVYFLPPSNQLTELWVFLQVPESFVFLVTWD